MSRVIIKKGRVRPIWVGHPWVYAQAIHRIEGAPVAGDEIDVVDPEGKLLGRGYWSPDSAIPVRILTYDQEPLGPGFLEARIRRAAALRSEVLSLPTEETTGYRLVHSEGDRLGGLIVDILGDTAAVQVLSAGMHRRQEDIFGVLARLSGIRHVLAIGNDKTKKNEGFETETRFVRGGDRAILEFTESGLDYAIPSPTAEDALSQKTGFYFDQRGNRTWFASLSEGRRVLDAFCYVGSFALAAARGGATQVLALDSSAPAITVGAELAQRNRLSDRIQFARADLKRELPRLASEGATFDLINLDPPKLAATARNLNAGRRAYARVNENAMRLLVQGGLLMTHSCSAAMKDDDLFRTVGMAAKKLGRVATLVGSGGQAPDHPVVAPFAEGRYLCSLLFRVD